MVKLYIYDCGDLYPVEETRFSFKTWEMSLLATSMILKFNLRSDLPYTINLLLLLDLFHHKSYKINNNQEENDLWEEASPIDRCWHTWQNYTEMN